MVPPDFVLGNLFDKSCDYELTHLVRSELQAMGYIVAVNKPYAGGYVTKRIWQSTKWRACVADRNQSSPLS